MHGLQKGYMPDDMRRVVGPKPKQFTSKSAFLHNEAKAREYEA